MDAWNSALWHFLHTISFNYPVNPSRKNKCEYKLFLKALKSVTNDCFELEFDEHTFNNRETFSKFIHRLRKKSQSCHKRPYNKTYKICQRQYECFRARCNKNKTALTKSGKERGCVRAAYQYSKCQVLLEPISKCRRVEMKVDQNCTMKSKKFCKKDFQSDNGMVTRIWGGALWHVLHSLSIHFPDKPTLKQSKNYYNFFKRLEHVLPCCYCRNNYKGNLKQAHFDLEQFKSKTTTTKFVYNLHNAVNKCLKKTKFEKTYSKWKKEYELLMNGDYQCTIKVVKSGKPFKVVKN